jgi:hypothetical protein
MSPHARGGAPGEPTLLERIREVLRHGGEVEIEAVRLRFGQRGAVALNELSRRGEAERVRLGVYKAVRR